jgi:tetratricopeptide (TPR) repeat protein
MSGLFSIRVALLGLMLILAVSVWAQKDKPALPPIIETQTAIKRDPMNPALYVQLGLAYWDANDYRHALEAFQQAVKIGPNSAEAHNWLGVALMGKADLPNAIAEFRKAVSLDAKFGRGYTNLGSALAKSGDLSEAIEVFQKALTLEPNSLAAHMNLGIALRDKGDAQGALPHLKRVADADPKNAAIQYELGQTLRQNGDLAGAIGAFERALELNPELSEGYYGLGLALKQQSASIRKPVAPIPSAADDLYKSAQESAAKGYLDKAKQELVTALQKDDHHAEAHNLLGYILGQEGNLPAAIAELQRAVSLRPGSADAHYNLGVALWYSGSKEKAIAELKESVSLDPAAGASYEFLGNALRDTGDLVGARLSLQRAIAFLPPTTATYVDLGIVFLRMGELDRALGQFEAGLNAPSSVPTPDWDSAIGGLREALAKNAGRADAHNMLGLLLGRKGAQSDQVLAEFREAVRLRPDFAEAHNNIGLVLAQSDKDDAAIAEFKEAIRVRPNFADAHANLGATLIPTDAERAISELEKAVSLNPASVKAQFNLAQAYAASPNSGPAKEIEQLRKVTAMAATFAPAHLALGKALLHDGKIAEAVTELQEATRLDPQSGEAHYQLGLALTRAGKREEGTAEVQKGRELSAADERAQNANLDLAEGRAALDKGDLEQAATKFRHAVKLSPDSGDAQRYLGIVLEKQNDAKGAATAYRKALDLNPGDQAAKEGLERLIIPDSPSQTALHASREDDPTKISEFEDYIRQSKFQEVEPLLAAYVKERPTSSWGWYALGYVQFAQKKIGESIQSLAQSLQLNIRNAEAHKILGRDLMIIGRFDAAQTEFEQGIRYDPTSAELHYDLGKLFSMQDNWESARKEFQEAVRLKPSYLEATDALGFALEALGDDAGAVANYEKAIALNEERHGNFASADVNLSAYYNRTGDPAKGLDYAQKALDLDPKSDRAWFQKARAAELQGRTQDAADALEHAVALNLRSSSYYYVLAGLYRRLGKKTESEEALKAFRRLDQENAALDKMRRNAAKAAAASSAGGPRE